MNKNIIVFGATGKLGKQICKQLTLKKFKTSAFVRKESIDKLNMDNLNIIIGDVLNETDVVDAFNTENFTDIIISLGSAALRNTDIRSKGTENIVNAMKSSNPNSKIHLVSALGVGESWGQLKWHAKLLSKIILKSVMIDHQKQEELVTKSSFEHHILRPVGLTNDESNGKIHVQAEGFLPSETISRTAVAKYLIESMIENKKGTSSICQLK